jgi:hypothetical protein
MEQATAFVSTTLTSDLGQTDLVVLVTDTSGFLASDIIDIDSEVICYSSKTSTSFIINNIDGRGCRGTEAKSHSTGALVLSQSAGILNSALGFNAQEVVTDAGILDVIKAFGFGTLRAVTKFVLWDYAFLDGDFRIIKFLFLYPISAGFVITLSLQSSNLISFFAKILTGR